MVSVYLITSFKLAVVLLFAVVFLLSHGGQSIHAWEQNRRTKVSSTNRYRNLIVGGEKVSANNVYPFFVNLGACGGALIHGDIVLTAAHVSMVSTELV